MGDWFQQFLGKVGGKLDAQAGGASAVRELVLKLVPHVQRAIEQQARTDGGRHVAPHVIRIALPYELHRSLLESARQSLAEQVQESAENFIRDRRYGLTGKLEVHVLSDVFRDQPSVKVGFEREGTAANPQAMTVRLVTVQEKELFAGPLKPGDSIRLGRAQGNTVVLDDGSVSKFHAVLLLDAQNRLTVQDLGSTNGTFVGSAASRLEGAALLASGETVSFGDVAVRITLT
ncbi:MAG: FHA domain-containing protein [Blastocatellia bacterium]|nr:FHA domain-containing protein [Blastocatellia bacterium]